MNYKVDFVLPFPLYLNSDKFDVLFEDKVIQLNLKIKHSNENSIQLNGSLKNEYTGAIHSTKISAIITDVEKTDTSERKGFRLENGVLLYPSGPKTATDIVIDLSIKATNKLIDFYRLVMHKSEILIKSLFHGNELLLDNI